MPAFKDITGQRFGRLVALREQGRSGTAILWLCQCDCGETTLARIADMKRGRKQSCGCLHRENTIARNIGRKLHGQSETKTWLAWKNMLSRCYNKNHNSYHRYGGRGIKVEDLLWFAYVNFVSEMGESPPGTSLDRINNELGYFAANCRWATPKQQANNRSPKRRASRGSS